HGRVEGPQGGLPGDRRVRVLDLQLLLREHLLRGPALLRRRLSRNPPRTAPVPRRTPRPAGHRRSAAPGRTRDPETGTTGRSAKKLEETRRSAKEREAAAGR